MLFPYVETYRHLCEGAKMTGNTSNSECPALFGLNKAIFIKPKCLQRK